MKSLNKITLTKNLGNNPKVPTLEGDIKLAKLFNCSPNNTKSTTKLVRTEKPFEVIDNVHYRVVGSVNDLKI